MSRCGQELCPHWTGDGRVCMCVVLGIDGFHSKRDVCAGCSEPERCGVHRGDECPGWIGVDAELEGDAS